MIKHLLSQCPCPESLDDLRRVGETKAVGYLPLAAVGSSELLVALLDEAATKGLCFETFAEPRCIIGSGSVWVWHRDQLQGLLKQHASALRKAGVPTQAKPYIRHIAKYLIQDPDAYRVVGLTFNDKRFRAESCEWCKQSPCAGTWYDGAMNQMQICLPT